MERLPLLHRTNPPAAAFLLLATNSANKSPGTFSKTTFLSEP
jgi:hypothetical protein